MRLSLVFFLAVPLAVVVFVAIFLIASASAGDPTDTGRRLAILALEPLCSLPRSDCALIPVSEQSGYQTRLFATGDTLEMNIVALRPDLVSGGRIRANLSYNPILLRGELQSMSEQVRGDVTFVPEQGIARMDIALPLQQREKMVVASVRFTVSRVSATETVIALRDLHGYGSHVPGKEEDRRTTVAMHFAQDSVDDPDPVKTGPGDTDPVDTSPPVDPEFAQLKIPYVVATVGGENVQLHWIEPAYHDLKGYKIVYGTGSHVYTRTLYTGIQNTHYVFRNLSRGTTYYFSVLAVQDDGTESALSEETSTTVGRQEFVPLALK